MAPLVFKPNETKRLSVAEMLASLKLDVAQVPEGRITIIQRGPNPALVAQGRVTDPVTGFSTTLEFPDPAHERSSALHASGIPVGTPTADSPYAGDGTFTPHVIVSNLGSQPQSVTITAEYPEGTKLVPVGEKEFDGESGTAVGQMTLATLQVPTDSTEDFSLAAEIGQLPLPIPYASLRIQYSGAAGSMITQVSSVDEQQDLVVDARTANEGDGWAGSGVNPWHLDSQTNSILFLTDESDKPARIGFRVTAGSVTYWLTSLELKPHETRAIDFRKLRDTQQADFKGNKVPAGATDGGVSWIRLDSVAVEGRLMVIQKEQGMASSYDCEACSCPAGFSSLSVAPASFGIIPTAYPDMSDTATYHSCNGSGNFYYNLTAGSSWTSNNTTVIQMNSSIHYRAVGMSGGTANVTGSFTDCSMYDTNPDFDCPCISQSTYCGVGTGNVGPYPVNFYRVGGQPWGTGALWISYVWDSSTGNLADLSSCAVYEIVKCPNYPNTTYIWPRPPWDTQTDNPTVTGAPGTDGMFSDFVYPGTFLKPYQAANFHATQDFKYACNGGPQQSLMSSIDHFRQVSQNPNSSFKYVVTVAGQYSNSINPLP